MDLFACDWKKHGEVLTPSKQWEGNRIQNFTSTVDPIGENQWRLWYSVNWPNHYNIAVAHGSPEHGWTKSPAHLSASSPQDRPLSIGNLPKGWRPIQPVYLKLQDGCHRLYFWAHGPNVVRYLAANSDDGHRFEVVDPARPCLYHPNDRAVVASTIPGLTPHKIEQDTKPISERSADAALICNDATTVYQLDDGTFELYSVTLKPIRQDDPGYVSYDNAVGWRRVIVRWASEDGLQWGQRTEVLMPDAYDPPDLQFYYLSVTHTPKGRVGLLGHYRVQAQTIDMECCFSADGLTWERPYRNSSLGRKSNQFMHYPPRKIILANDQWWLFYTEANYKHNHSFSAGPEKSVIKLATTKAY